jgi:NagD protein
LRELGRRFLLLTNNSIAATGSVAALISRATGVAPYFVCKPNPLMMRSALNALEAHSGNAVIVGDRTDTDVVAGIEAGIETPRAQRRHRS